MILEGNERGGGVALALHLMNDATNDHVSVHEIRGFVSDDLKGAFKEAFALSKGTRCEKYLFSLSLSPPQDADVSIEAFEKAISDIEGRLGLTGQPRAIVFHEKNGRRHAHCVWSRIDGLQMKAVNLSLYKKKLNSISRQLYLQHGWELPKGLENKQNRDPLNYSRQEAEQAKRLGLDAKDLKQVFLDCWTASDSRAAFAGALSEHGLILAKGDRRAFVAVGLDGEVYSISRWTGVKSKELLNRFGDPSDLPSIEEAQQLHHDRGISNNDRRREAVKAKFKQDIDALQVKRDELVVKQRSARCELKTVQETRRTNEVKHRAANLPKGIRAVWAKLSGHYDEIIRANEEEFALCKRRDQAELHELIQAQLKERRLLLGELKKLEQSQNLALQRLEQQQPSADPNKSLSTAFGLLSDPNQPLILPDQTEEFYSKSEVQKYPDRILDIITDKQERFSRYDIVRGLSKYIYDPLKLGLAIDQVMRSDKLVQVNESKKPDYSTKEFLDLKSSMMDKAQNLSANKRLGVSPRHVKTAIDRQNAELQKSVGAHLSDEQIEAIEHVTNDDQLSLIVGYAGAGKSTMLKAANDAWTKQGYRVRGASLSGKATDGLQSSSGIESRTLASLELSWKNGNHLLMPNDILVIDEAGMIGTRQLKRFIDHVHSKGAKLVLVGDPEQLQPINAGTPFKELVETLPHHRLTEIHRQNQDWQRQATQDFGSRQTDKALKAYQDHGLIETTSNHNDPIAKLVEDYMVDLELRGIEASRIALAHARKDVHAINQAIRKLRQSGGDLQDEQLYKTEHGPRAFAKGDRIVFTENDHAIGVRNGSKGIVTKTSENLIGVKLDSDSKSSEISSSPHQNKSFDHGYATTIHKSQGVTVDRAFVLSSDRTDNHLTYVAMSRHKDNAKMYRVKSQKQHKFELGQKKSHAVNTGWQRKLH